MSKLEKTDIDGCLISEQFATEICKHMDDNDIHAAPPSAATSIPIADNETDADIRTGQLGTSDDYARADHNHPIRRQSNPGDPVFTYLWDTDSSLFATNILDRWSDEESYSYRVRIGGNYGAGTGWNYITVPTKAGFQQPMILDVGTYRFTSNTAQDDDAGGAGGDGASPRGPFMAKEAHHWSSTNRIYHGFFRRDNAYRMYTEFTITYIRS